MQLLKLKITNAFAFGKDVLIDFEALNKHTQLVGVNLEEDADGNASNGSGKTSIVLALQECLYSKNAKGIKKDDISNRKLKKGNSIEVIFRADEAVYSVKSSRSTGGKGSLVLKRDGVDISEHTMRGTLAKIEEVIGLDWNTFVQLTYQSADKTLDILRANEAARTKLLLNLFNLNDYLDQALEAKEVNKLAKSHLRERVLLQERLADQIDVEIEPELTNVEFTLDDEIEKSESEIIGLRVELQTVDEHNERVATELREVGNHNRKIDEVERDITHFQIKIKGKELKPYSQEEMDEVLLDIRTTDLEIASLHNDVTIYGEEPKDCRLCGSTVKTGFNQEQLDFAKAQLNISGGILEKLKYRKEELYGANNHNNIIIGAESKIERLREQLVERKTVSLSHKSISELQEQLSVAESSSQTLKKLRSDTAETNKRVDLHNAVRAERIEQKVKAESELEKADIEVDEANNAEATSAVLADALDKLTKFKLENLLITLQDSVNDYMSIFFNGDKSLLIGLKNNKLSFKLLIDGDEVAIETLSGGEYSRTATALLFAVREALSRVSGVNIDFLILDEVLATLDTQGIEALYEVIEQLNCKVLSVSHSVFDNKLDCITVIKNKDGVAHVEQ